MDGLSMMIEDCFACGFSIDLGGVIEVANGGTIFKGEVPFDGGTEVGGC